MKNDELRMKNRCLMKNEECRLRLRMKNFHPDGILRSSFLILHS